jgi:hypothetical protein
MRTRTASSLIALAILTAACESAESAEEVAPLVVESEGESADADTAEERGRTVQRGELAFGVSRSDAIELALERHAYLLEVEGETVVTLEAEGLTGDLTPSLTVHAPLLAGFNPQALAIGEAEAEGEAARIQEIVLPEAGVYLVVVGSHDEQGRGAYRLQAQCDGGACAVESPFAGQCLPAVADRIADCADWVMDAVDQNPEDGVLTALDALHICTRPHELAPAYAEVCQDTLLPGCGGSVQPFVEGQAAACTEALAGDFEAPLDLTEIPVPDHITEALETAMAERCAEGTCSVELRAFAYGDQFPTLREATLVTAAMSEPDLGGSYTHRSASWLDQRLEALAIRGVFGDLHTALDLTGQPVVGRLMGSMEIAPNTDLLVETHAALYRGDNVIVTVRATEHAS